MLAQVATATFKGRTTAATGNVEDLTTAQATALLNLFSSTLNGVVPASGGGTTNFLRADGTWAAASGGGGLTVTNDITTNSNNYFPLLSNNVTSGTLSAAVTSNTDLYFNPSTGTLSAIIFNSLSDANRKTNIRTISDSNVIINTIKGVRFNWSDSGLSSAGLIAQDVEKVMPELVSENEQGVKSLNYNGIIGVLVETIKELKQEIQDLSYRVSELEKH
jgi:hypothetical protein